MMKIIKKEFTDALAEANGCFDKPTNNSASKNLNSFTFAGTSASKKVNPFEFAGTSARMNVNTFAFAGTSARMNVNTFAFAYVSANKNENLFYHLLPPDGLKCEAFVQCYHKK